MSIMSDPDKQYGFIQFSLSVDQLKKLTKWKEAIRTVYGEYGSFTYKFTPNGIGDGVEVYSDLAKISTDLTEYDKF